MAAERAYGAALRPEDSPRSWGGHKQPTRRLNGTWELVELPKGRKAIGSRWVFLIKQKSDGSIDLYKGRLVAKGYSQAPGIDFDQVFAPAARLAALCAILAQAALAGKHIESLDISNAYLPQWRIGKRVQSLHEAAQRL